MERRELKSILEGFLFVSDKPLGASEIHQMVGEEDAGDSTSLTPASRAESRGAGAIRDALLELQQEYDSAERGIRLEEVAGGFRLVTDPRLGPWLKKFYRARQKASLSKPALETLAIVAYRQPITRAEM